MVNNSEHQLDNVFHALSDPTRRAILARLVRGQCNVSELPNPFGVSKAAISKHLTMLERANLIDKRRSGREIHCNANLAPFDEVHELLEELGRFWRSRLDALEQFFSENVKKESKDESSKRNVSKRRNKKGDPR